jgi:hypothetical protein
VRGVLRNGEAVAGRLESEPVVLAVILAGRETADLEIHSPASWSSLSTAGEVEWLPDREIYVIRGTSFTAEALHILAPLKLQDASGKLFEISWDEVRLLRFLPHR